MTTQFHDCSAEVLLHEKIAPASCDLVLIDPPYYGIVEDVWDNQWKSEDDYVTWLYGILHRAKKCLKPTGSLLMFGGIGKHGSHPFFKIIQAVEDTHGWSLFHFRNMITWKKRRAYGKSHDYLFCREEIVWFSVSPERTAVTFNIPLLDVKRGYAGFDKDHPAKSEFKRVSNVWDDIPELMRPRRSCEKPIPLLKRLIATHSNPGDLVVDCFAGTGSTARACAELGRNFVGCDTDPTLRSTFWSAIEDASRPLQEATVRDLHRETVEVGQHLQPPEGLVS